MTRKTQVVSISLPKTEYERLQKLAKIKAKTKSALIRDLIQLYSQEELDLLWQKIRRAGERARQTYKIKTEEDVLNLIHARRKI